MMMLASYLTEAAFFRTAGYYALRIAHTPRMLLVAVAVISALLSAFLVNDTVCLMLTPLVLRGGRGREAAAGALPARRVHGLQRRLGGDLHRQPAEHADPGRVGIPYARSRAFMTLPAVLSTGVVIAVLLLRLRKPSCPTGASNRTRRRRRSRSRLMALTLIVLAGVVVAFFAGPAHGLERARRCGAW